MAKARKKAVKAAAKKPASKSTKPRAKRAAAGQKRASARRKPPREMSFIDHFLQIFAQPEPPPKVKSGKRNAR